MPTFPYLRIRFLNTRHAFSIHRSTQNMLRNLVATDELPDEFASPIRIENLNSLVALKGAGRSLVRRKDCLERRQSSEEGMFVALVH